MFQAILGWWIFVQKMPQTNTASQEASTLPLAMYPAYMWATINRDPRHVERCLPLELTKQNAHLSWQCLEIIHLGESSLPSQIYASNLQVGQKWGVQSPEAVNVLSTARSPLQKHKGVVKNPRNMAKTCLQLNRVWKVDFEEFLVMFAFFFGVFFATFAWKTYFFRHAENWFWH